MARRHGLTARLAFCAPACPRRASRLQPECGADRRVAVGRMAEERGRTDKILALNRSGDDRLQASGRPCQAALAHRARLPGAQAGGGARPFRGARMARLSPSCHAVHRSLRIPDLRTGDDSPSQSRSNRRFAAAALPESYRPRGSAAAARASHPQLDRNHAPPSHRRADQNSPAMPMLLSTNSKTLATEEFVMQ